MQKQSLLLPGDKASHRIPLYDALKGLAIILVVYAHCLQYLGMEEYIHHPVVCFIYSFHMPLFMTLSGYFAYPLVSSVPLGAFVWHKAVRLLVPAVCFGLLTLSIMDVTGHPVKSGWFSYLYGNLWYLKSLFLCLLISRIAATVLGNEICAAMTTVVLSWFLPNLFHLNFMLPFFWLGYFLRKYGLTDTSLGISANGKNRPPSCRRYYFPERFYNILITVSFMFWMVLEIFWDGTHTTYLAPFGMIDYTRMQWMPHNIYSYALRILIGIAGTFCVLFFFLKVYSKGIRLIHLERLGKHTLAIYALQTLWLEIIVTCGINWGYRPVIYEALYCPLATMLIVVISYAMAKGYQLGKYLLNLK